MKYNTWGSVIGINGDGVPFVYFHPNDVKISARWQQDGSRKADVFFRKSLVFTVYFIFGN